MSANAIAHRLVDDRVAAIDRLCLVTDNRYRDRLWPPRPLERANGRPPHVVNQLPGTASRLAGVLPRRAEGPDPFAIAVEDERADRACGLQPFVRGDWKAVH